MATRLITSQNFQLVIVPHATYAGPYYVAPSGGSDSNDGSQASPWATVAYGVSNLHAGDILYLLDGSHSITAPIVINSFGTSSNWIKIQAVNRRAATLNGGGSTLSAFSFGNAGPAYWQIDGIVFQNFANWGIDIQSTMAQTHDVSVTNCTFQNIGRRSYSGTVGAPPLAGVFVSAGHYNLTFLANAFNAIGRTNTGSDLQSDQALDLNSSNTLVANNIFWPPVSGWHVQVRGAFQGQIVNNTFSGPHDQMINDAGGYLVLYQTSVPITISNNIFNDVPNVYAIFGCAMQPGAAGSSIQNNFIAPWGTLSEGYNDRIPDQCGGSTISGATGTLHDLGDAQFVGGANPTTIAGFQLTNPGSPAIGAGVAISQITTDFLGNPRPGSSGWDLGAYQT